MQIDPSLLSLVTGVLIGMAVPSYYGLERLAGFGRWAMSEFIPYEPPPGKSEKEALREATNPDDGDGGQ